MAETAFLELINEDAQAALQLITGMFVGLTLEWIKREGHDPRKQVTVGADGQRKVTIAAEPGHEGVPEYVDGVNVKRLQDALTWLGVASDSHESTVARMDDFVNEITAAVMRHKALFLRRSEPVDPHQVIDYRGLIAAATKRHGYAQGTKACVAFSRGAEYAVETYGAAPATQAAPHG